MPSVITEFGRDWVVDRAVHGDDYPEQKYFVVGTGTTDPEESDIELETEIYETTFEDANANIYSVSDSLGVYRANITLSGGTEIDADTEVSEFGILTSNRDMVYREVRSPTTIGSGERISFELEIEFINVS